MHPSTSISQAFWTVAAARGGGFKHGPLDLLTLSVQEAFLLRVEPQSQRSIWPLTAGNAGGFGPLMPRSRSGGRRAEAQRIQEAEPLAESLRIPGHRDLGKKRA